MRLYELVFGALDLHHRPLARGFFGNIGVSNRVPMGILV